MLYDNLLLGHTGRSVNSVGAGATLASRIAGSVVWRPGVHSWRPSMLMNWSASSKRLVWTLHSVFGFWFFFFVSLWGLSAVYLCFPAPFSRLLSLFLPIDPYNTNPRSGDVAIYWLSRLHFGRFAGTSVEAVWSTAGLVPAALFVTGAAMFWNRVLHIRVRRWNRGSLEKTTGD